MSPSLIAASTARLERGHRTLRIIGKGHRPVVVPLVPRTARTIDLALVERIIGPIPTRHDGARLDARTAYRWIRSIGTRAGLQHVHPHALRAAFIIADLDAGVPLRDVQLAARLSSRAGAVGGPVRSGSAVGGGGLPSSLTPVGT